MKRRSLITAISLPKETGNILLTLQNKFHKTRSELLREMISFYVESTKKETVKVKHNEYLDDSDVNKVLKLYYQLLSGRKNKPTIIIGIALINRGNKVIIGLRKNKDFNIKDLTWTFPSGAFNTLDFEKEVEVTAKRETKLNSKVINLVHARLIPDSPEKKVRIIALYYHCKYLFGKEKPGGDFKQVKWVPANEVHRHFTTSVADEVTTFLGTL